MANDSISHCLEWQMSWIVNILDGKCLGWHLVRVALGIGGKWLAGIMNSLT